MAIRCRRLGETKSLPRFVFIIVLLLSCFLPPSSSKKVKMKRNLNANEAKKERIVVEEREDGFPRYIPSCILTRTYLGGKKTPIKTCRLVTRSVRHRTVFVEHLQQRNSRTGIWWRSFPWRQRSNSMLLAHHFQLNMHTSWQ